MQRQERGRKEPSEFNVIVKCKDLIKHTFTITNSTERFPKKYRFTLVNRIQDKAVDIYECALEANELNLLDAQDVYKRQMQTNLNNTRAEMVKVQRELDDTSKKLKSSKIDWESVGDTVGKVGKAIGAGVAAMGAAIGAAATAFLGLAESTREARENMGKLEAALQRRGIRRKMQRTLIPNCTAFLATTDRRPKPPPTLHSLRTTNKSLRRGRI